MSKEGKPVTMQVKLIGKHHPNQLLPVFGKQQGNKLLEVVRATPIAASTSQVSTANVLTVCSTAITSTAAAEQQPVRRTEGAAVTVIQESSALGGNSHTTATALSSISSSEDDNNDSSLLCLDDQVLDF